jgi:hypothetical protein
MGGVRSNLMPLLARRCLCSFTTRSRTGWHAILSVGLPPESTPVTVLMLILLQM